MGSQKELFNKYPLYADPFNSPRANPKHTAAQVVGETEKNLHDQIMAVWKKKHHR